MPKVGFKFSLESRKKLSDARKGSLNAMYGRKHKEDSKRKIGVGNTNPSAETRIKIGLCHVGKKVWEGRTHSEESKQKISTSLKGKKRAPFKDCTKKKISLANIGEKNFFWKGGITPLNKKIRTSQEYKDWRKKVFERDSYICVIGGKDHGSDIQADHIKSFANHPELRFDVSNGRTLCVSCHKNTETYGWRSYNKEKSSQTSGTVLS